MASSLPPLNVSKESEEKAESICVFAQEELGLTLTEWQYRLIAIMIEHPDATFKLPKGRKGTYIG